MPLISVKVIARAKQNSVTVDHGRLKVRLTAPAVEGRANQALIRLLAAHYQIKTSAVTIVRGHRSGHKIIRLASPTSP